MKNLEIYKAINQTEREFPELLLHHVIDRRCEESPDAIAVLFDDQQLTYSQLRTRSNQLARYLRDQGVGRGDLVGVCCERNLDVPVLLLGIMKSGAGYVPLDPEYPVDRLEYMVENSGIRHVVGHSQQSQLIERFDMFRQGLDKACCQLCHPRL